MGTRPASASEAMDMVHAGLGYLAAADATAMAAETQARCLQLLEQAHSMGTAARASILAVFTSGQGYSADADYSPRAFQWASTTAVLRDIWPVFAGSGWSWRSTGGAGASGTRSMRRFGWGLWWSGVPGDGGPRRA